MARKTKSKIQVPEAPGAQPERRAPTEPVLTCPYTGLALTVEFIPWSGVYTVKGGYDPGMWQDQEVLERTIRGASQGRLVCAYSGHPVTLVRHSTGLARAEGACSPSQMWKERTHALYDISIRGGVHPAFSREPEVVAVGFEKRKESDPSVGWGSKNAAFIDHVVDSVIAK